MGGYVETTSQIRGKMADNWRQGTPYELCVPSGYYEIPSYQGGRQQYWDVARQGGVNQRLDGDPRMPLKHAYQYDKMQEALFEESDVSVRQSDQHIALRNKAMHRNSKFCKEPTYQVSAAGGFTQKRATWSHGCSGNPTEQAVMNTRPVTASCHTSPSVGDPGNNEDSTIRNNQRVTLDHVQDHNEAPQGLRTASRSSSPSGDTAPPVLNLEQPNGVELKALLGLSGDLSYVAKIPNVCNQVHVADVMMARLITALADNTLGNPALLLQQLLGFSPEDYSDLLSALSESGCSYVDILAAYLHNIRVVSEDGAGDGSFIADNLQSGIVSKYHELLQEISKATALGPSASDGHQSKNVPRQTYQTRAPQGSSEQALLMRLQSCLAPTLATSNNGPGPVQGKENTGPAPIGMNAQYGPQYYAVTSAPAATAPGQVMIPVELQSSGLVGMNNMLNTSVQGNRAPAQPQPQYPQFPCAPTAKVEQMIDPASTYNMLRSIMPTLQNMTNNVGMANSGSWATWQ